MFHLDRRLPTAYLPVPVLCECVEQFYMFSLIPLCNKDSSDCIFQSKQRTEVGSRTLVVTAQGDLRIHRQYTPIVKSRGI
jgi:hypothetical protein